MSDEQRRSPSNLMWLCVKHHKTVDGNPSKYTVDVLLKWKLHRESADPDQRVISGLMEERLEEVISGAMDRLVDQLEELNLPGAEVAEMLVGASAKMPGEDIASMLLDASRRMPGEDVASALAVAGDRMPGEDVAEMLLRAAERMPDEDVARLLMWAAEKMPDREWLSSLDNRVAALNHASDRIVNVMIEASNSRNESDKYRDLDNPWAWFAAGAITVVVGMAIVTIVAAWIAHN